MWDEEKPRLKARLFNVAGPEAPLEDLLQDVFVRVYAKADRLRPDFAQNYLMRTASNTARDYLRRHSSLPVFEPLLANRETPYELRTRGELQDFYERELRPAVAALPDRQRESLEWYLNEEPRRNHARRLSMPETTLRSRELVALNNLRNHLGADRVADLVALYGR